MADIGVSSNGQGAGDQPPVMHKGCYVVATFFVEGDDAPAHDFAQTATDVVKKLCDAAVAQRTRPQFAMAIATSWLRATPKGVTVTVKKIKASDDAPDDA